MEMFVLRFCVLVLLGIIGFQDFKYRGISWYLFPVLALLLGWLNPLYAPRSAMLNLGFIALVFVLLTLWFSLRSGKLVNLLNTHIGLGDLLFLGCLSFYFSFENFFLFYLVSLILISLGAWIYQLYSKKSEFTIPLAGLQGAVLMVLLLANWIQGIEFSGIHLLAQLL